MKETTPSQRKITIVFAVIISAFFAFWLFIYLPSKNTLTRIKAELFDVENQLRQIETMMGEGKSIAESIQATMERYRQLYTQFPEKEEESLRILSQLSRELNIELIAIQPQPRTTFLDQDNKEILIEGKVCRVCFVSIEMGCFYKDLVKYIEALRKTLPAFATIEKLNLKKAQSEIPKLRVTLGINLYFLT